MVLEKSSEIHYIIKNEFFQGVHIFFSYCGKSEFVLARTALVRRIFVCGGRDLCAAPGFHFVKV